MRRILLVLLLLSCATDLLAKFTKVGPKGVPQIWRNDDDQDVQFTAPALDAANPALDAFNRLRVSQPETLFDSSMVNGFQHIFWTSLTSTGGSWVHDTSYSSLTLTAAAGSAVTVTVRTRQYWTYQPGKSQLILMTGNFLPSSGTAGTDVQKYIGYMDETNGIYFNLRTVTATHTFSVGFRARGIDTKTTQANWNVDPMDGTGPSKKTLSVGAANIYGIDFEWLGVGTIRWFVVIDGKIYYVHQNKWANANLSTYMPKPNLPLQYQIKGDVAGNSQRLIQICSTVASEGGSQFVGVHAVASREGTALTSVPTGAWYPLVALRGVSWTPTVRIMPSKFSAISTTTANSHIALALNPTLVADGTWRSITGTPCEMNTGITGTADINAALVYEDEYFTDSISGANIKFSPFIGTGVDAAGTRDIWVLCVRKLGSTGTDDFYGSISFEVR